MNKITLLLIAISIIILIATLIIPRINKQIKLLIIGLVIVPIAIIGIMLFLDKTIHIHKMHSLNWVIYFSIFIAYLLVGFMNRKTSIKFTPILLISSIVLLYYIADDLIFASSLIAIASLIITRKEIKKIYRIPTLFLLISFISFEAYSEPLILNKMKIVNINGREVNTIVGRNTIWEGSKKAVEFPDITFKDLNDNDIKLTDFKGKKVFITFWALSCGPCFGLKPILEENKTELENAKDIVFIDIALQKDTESWKNYINKNKPKGIQLIAKNSRSNMKKLNISVFPSGATIKSNGEYSASHGLRADAIDVVKLMKGLE